MQNDIVCGKMSVDVDDFLCMVSRQVREEKGSDIDNGNKHAKRFSILITLCFV